MARDSRDYRASDEYIESEELNTALLKALVGLFGPRPHGLGEQGRWETLLREFTPETNRLIGRVGDLLGPAGKEALQALIEAVRDDTVTRCHEEDDY